MRADYLYAQPLACSHCLRVYISSTSGPLLKNSSFLNHGRSKEADSPGSDSPLVQSCIVSGILLLAAAAHCTAQHSLGSFVGGRSRLPRCSVKTTTKGLPYYYFLQQLQPQHHPPPTSKKIPHSLRAPLPPCRREQINFKRHPVPPLSNPPPRFLDSLRPVSFLVQFVDPHLLLSITENPTRSVHPQ